MPDRVKELEEQILKLKQELVSERKKVPSPRVGNYTFRNADGSSASLCELFGTKSDLIVIHNMGRACPYCTVWADGFNGLTLHLNDRASFALASPDEPAIMAQFAQGRNWRFRTVSTSGTSFGKDMGYEPDPGKYMPGMSVFSARADGQIVRTGTAQFGPGDDFCALWPMFDLLAQGVNDWQPKYVYS